MRSPESPPEILELTQKAEPQWAVRAARVWGWRWDGVGLGAQWSRGKDEKRRPNGPCHSVFPICPLIVHKQRAVLSWGTVPASRCH